MKTSQILCMTLLEEYYKYILSLLSNLTGISVIEMQTKSKRSHEWDTKPSPLPYAFCQCTYMYCKIMQ